MLAGKSVLLRILLLMFAIYVSYTLINLQVELIDSKQELKERESYLKETTIKVRINEDMKNHIEKMAKRKYISMSEYMRDLIQRDMRGKL